MRARTTIVCSAALLAAVPPGVQAQEPPACEQAPGAGQAAVVGALKDGKTGLPLQEGPVVVEWEGTRRKVEVETDERGQFRACGLDAGGRVKVTASFGPANDNRFVELRSGETQRLDFELDAPRSRAMGRVVEHGSSRGIAAAELRIEGSDVKAVSGGDGSFQLPDVPAGRYMLHTSHIGYGSREDTVEVSYGAIMRYTIGLAVDVIALDPIEVAVRSIVLERRGFYERADRGFGTFLTRQSWEMRMPQLPSDVLRNVPGVRVARRSGSYGNVILDRTNCAFRYFVDGVRVGETFQLDDIPAEWIEALEVYRGAATIPPEFRMPPWAARSTCGVIVVWTRSTS